MTNATCGECRFFKVTDERDGDAIGRCRLEKVMGVFRAHRESCRSFSRPGDTHLPPPDSGRRRGQRSHQAPSSLSFRVSSSALVELISSTEPTEVKARLGQALVSRAGLPSRDGFGHYSNLVLKPSDTGLQPKEIPYDQFLKKAFTIRDNMRVLEQKLNTDTILTDTEKLSFQNQLTRTQASLLEFVGGPINPGEDSLLADLVRDVEWSALMLTPPSLGEKWHGGQAVYSAGDGDISEPMSHFFHRLLLVRDRLMTLGAMLDARDDIPAATRATWTSYVLRSYGSLTTYNVLFRERADYFSSKAT